MKRLGFVSSRTTLPANGETLISKTLTTSSPFLRRFSMLSEDPELNEFITYLDNLKNYEKSGVPTDAGTDSNDGFNLGRMMRLMELLGDPQSKFKAVHIAGTKGKGSTAAFLSNILRAEGYSVGCYTSPHIQTIRERISVGRLCEPVSAKALNSHFQGIKGILDKAVKLENGYLSHFEVLTAVAFRIFADENIDVAVIEAGLGGARDATNIISSSGLAASVITTIDEEHLDALGGSLESIAMAKSGIIKSGCPVRIELDCLNGLNFQLVLGGPFLSKIEHILCSKAMLMGSPVVSASNIGNRSIIKGVSYIHGKPCQSCDVVLGIEKDIKLFLELFNVNLCMLGPHQLQNAATATCTALCLRHQGWRVSDVAICAGLEQTTLLGRSQFLTPKEAEELGVTGTAILLDGAHTKGSAKALAYIIQMTFPKARLVLVVAMASDKDHVSFARELLSARQLDAIVLTEISIAGDRSRSTPLPLLKDSWIRASKEVGADIQDFGDAEVSELLESRSVCYTTQALQHKTVLLGKKSLMDSLRPANQVLRKKGGDQSGIIVVTGSLHIVSSVLYSLRP